MDFQELSLTFGAEQDISTIMDIMIAELGTIGYDSFVENPNSLLAYITLDQWDPKEIDALIQRYESFGIKYTTKQIPKTNWNQKWEESYEPIIIKEQCIVKASFHKDLPSYPYEIIINPKMSFGTGHHETTSMMLEHLLNIDVQAKSVMDAGCGTGVLAILAAQLGAKSIVAFDIDEWSVENTQENFALNQVTQAELFQGTVKEVAKVNEFNIILANINKNVLLEEMPLYVEHLAEHGLLVMSGFYEDDVPDLVQIGATKGLALQQTLTQNGWCSIILG